MNELVHVESAPKRQGSRMLLSGLALLSSGSLMAADIGQRFASVKTFLASLPQGSAEIDKGYGSLTGMTRRDWAGVVSLQDAEIGSAQRVVVLAQQADGSYRIAAQGPTMAMDGGTAHHGIDRVEIKQASVFVSWSWNWHGCGGTSAQQIKFYKNQWRVVGAEFNRANSLDADSGYDAGDSVRISHNLLTGAVVMHFKPADGQAETMTSKLVPSIQLLDDSFGEDTGAVEEFSTYASC